MRGMNKKEIIIVICLVVFSLMNIAAIGSGGRKRAKEIVCLSNLSQWGRVFEIYVNDNNGNFNTRYGDGGRWFDTICDYTSYTSMRLCPMASTLANPTGDQGINWWGSTFLGWGKVPMTLDAEGYIVYSYGSYGINGYVYVPGEDPLYKPAKRFWGTPYVDGALEIPLLMDCYWWCGWPDDDDTPPAYDGWADRSDEDSMNRFCLNRHDGGINCIFLDFSARKVGLKELWSLNWHKGFNRSNAWTPDGGVLPEDWPQWMKNFKEFGESLEICAE